MTRIFVAAMFTTSFLNSVTAGQLPEINIEAHCANVGGSDRSQRCSVAEEYARLWLRYHKIELPILYRCSTGLGPIARSYLELRACIVSENYGVQAGI
jgi:hypothetical protein